MNRVSLRPSDKAVKTVTSDAKALRARVLDIVEDAMGQVEDLLHDAPGKDEAVAAAGRVRHSRAVELVGTAVAAGVPIASQLVRRHASRRNATRVARVMPFVVRTHPVLFGAAVVCGAIVGVELLRRRRASGDEGNWRLLRRAERHQEEAATGFDLDEEVARMEDEGGDPGAYGPVPRHKRRFVRAGDGGPARTR